MVSLATILLGPLYAADSPGDLMVIELPVFALLFLASISFACNLNCYHDREVDSLKKRELSESVELIGLPTMKKIMVLENMVIFFCILFFLLSGHLPVAFLGLMGWLFSYIYSAPPFRFKGRGVVGPLPVILGVYVLPILAGHMILDPDLSSGFIFFVTGYAVLNLGINLVNVAEDYEVDMKCGISTAAHRLGVRTTVTLASLFTIIGSLTVIPFLSPRGLSLLSLLPFALLLSALVFTCADIGTIPLSKEPERVSGLKGKRLPLYFISTRYPMVLILLLSLM